MRKRGLLWRHHGKPSSACYYFDHNQDAEHSPRLALANFHVPCQHLLFVAKLEPSTDKAHLKSGPHTEYDSEAEPH